MKKSIILGGPGTIEDSIQVLSRALFRGDLVEDQIKKLPVQPLYYAIKNIGLQSSTDILEIITQKQYSNLLDFEFWTKDSFREDRFWAWLEVIDDPQNLLPIQKFINCADQTILAFLIRKYVDVVYNEEPDDPPPGPNFYTPDRGSTWISIKTHDPERHRLFGKLLAFIYQTNLDYFYRLLLQSMEGTSIEFEEIGYNEKTKRLEIESIPNHSESEQIHRSIKLNDFIKTLDLSKEDIIEETTAIIKSQSAFYQNAFYSGIKFQPLLSALDEVSEERFYEIQAEISKILNSAVVFFLNDFSEEENLRLLTEQVFGVINVGLQLAAKEKPEIISNQGLKNLLFTDVYRLGLSQFYELRSLAQKVPNDILSTLAHMNQPLSLLIESCRTSLPHVPSFLREDGSFEVIDTMAQEIMAQEIKEDEIKENSMSFKPIHSLEQLKSIKKIIQEQILDKFHEIRSYEASGKKHTVVLDNVTQEPQ